MVEYNINPKRDLIFNIKVCEACKSCKRYGLTGCCPPNIGTFDYYNKLLKQYKYGRIYVEQFYAAETENKLAVGRESSKILHNVLLSQKQTLLNEGHYFNVILGGGSCKWCEKCVIPCKMPHCRAIPIEATGLNVVATLHKFGIDIEFPVTTIFYRVGMILWD